MELTLTPHHAKYFAHDLTRRAASGMDRLSMALFDAAVDLNPHQIEAALFALQSPLSKGVILADEVGLGKRIEAGIVLCQFWAERKRRLLVICPASIRKQWALELEEKFNLPVKVLDAKVYSEARRSGQTPLGTNAVVVMPHHYAIRTCACSPSSSRILRPRRCAGSGAWRRARCSGGMSSFRKRTRTATSVHC